MIHIPMSQYEKYQYDFKSYSLFKNLEVPKIAWVFIAENETSWEHPFHMYENIGVLSFIMEGENQIQIGKENFYAEKNNITIMNPKVLRSEKQSHSLFSEVSVGLFDIHLPPFDKDIILPTPITPVFECFDYSAMLRKCFEIIKLEALKEDYESGMRCFDTIMFVLHIILNYIYPLNMSKYEKTGQTAADDESIVPYMIKNYIDQHYTENIKLETIAADLFFSTHYISHEFKNFFGMAPIQYLISRRIGEAHALLLQSDMPISAIAQKIGYTNINNFYIQFKKAKGISPSEFRSSSKNKESHFN